MATASEARRKLPSVTTLLLIAAALFAAISAGIALWRSYGGTGGGDSPGAADWRMVGWAYAERGDAEASANAYRRATVIEPGNAENWSSLAEALQTASTTVVPEAAEALHKALQLNPADPRARYFLAVQKDIQGDHRGALDDWLALLKDTPADAPWRVDLMRTIRQGADAHKIDVTSLLAEATSVPAAPASAIPGPTAEQLAAASSIPPSQQDAMARAMVERLATRLASSPRDADGWIRLMRSYIVLGERSRASEALASALAAFNGDVSTQDHLRQAAAQFGLTSSKISAESRR
jgi:cytochrome c-type biogenesis protein CcmH